MPLKRVKKIHSYVNLFVSSTDKDECINVAFFFFQDNLPNLKCFSLTCYDGTREYDNLIISLFRRMSHLEELTLQVTLVCRFTQLFLVEMLFLDP
jgi:hypothetical protein